MVFRKRALQAADDQGGRPLDKDNIAQPAALDNREATLRCDRADPLFPVQLQLTADGVGQIGWLLLGPRPDGSFYGREEREALREIAEPVARALAIAIERERRKAAQQQREDKLHDQIEALGRFMARKFGYDANGELACTAT